MSQVTLDSLIDECWLLLRPAYFRRAILGKRRCGQMVMTALCAFPEKAMEGVSRGSAAERRQRQKLAELLALQYHVEAPPTKGTYEAVFRLIVLPWAAGCIASHVFHLWYARRLSIQAIRGKYGWGNAT